MRNESVFARNTEYPRGDSAAAGESLPRIIVFVAGEQSRVEAAVDMARKLYSGRKLVFVCEPMHCAWLTQRAGESIFVVEQPFNPFGHRASELRKSLEAAPIDGCALVIADVGHESFRFRVFALRLRTRHFFLLDGTTPNGSKQLNRFSFALLAGLTLLLRSARKVHVNRQETAAPAHELGPSDHAPPRYEMTPQAQETAPPASEMAPLTHDMPPHRRKAPPQHATRDSGLIRMPDGWDDALCVILFINRLLIMVKPGARILDFGCGAGRMVFRLRELGFDAYGFDIHDYVAYRSDEDRQWFRFSQSTSRNPSAYTIDGDRYAIPFEDDFFDIIHSNSVLEHVLDVRPMMRECARVLRPEGVAVHFYPRKYQLVESHLYVPLGSFVQYKPWLRLWVTLGARAVLHDDRSVEEVTEHFKEYTMTGLRYRTRKELLYAAGEFFAGVRFFPPWAHNPSDSRWIQIRQMMKALRTLRTPDVYQQLGLCVRQWVMVCEHKKVGGQ